MRRGGLAVGPLPRVTRGPPRVEHPPYAERRRGGTDAARTRPSGRGGDGEMRRIAGSALPWTMRWVSSEKSSGSTSGSGDSGESGIGRIRSKGGDEAAAIAGVAVGGDGVGGGGVALAAAGTSPGRSKASSKGSGSGDGAALTYHSA